MRQDTPSKTRIEIRLTEQEKATIKDRAAAMNMTVSEFVRYACEKIFNQEGK